MSPDAQRTLAREPLRWSPIGIARAGQTTPTGDALLGTALEHDRILYLRPGPRGAVGVGVLDAGILEPGIDLARMPDMPTAKYLIEHARHLGPLPRTAQLLWRDACSFDTLDTDANGERVRRWFTVRTYGTYVITAGPAATRLAFERDDDDRTSVDLMSLRHGQELPWPGYLAPQRVHVALAQRLIALHDAHLAGLEKHRRDSDRSWSQKARAEAGLSEP